MNHAITDETYFLPVRSDADFERFIGRFTSYESMKSFHYGNTTMRLERMEGFADDLGRPDRCGRAIHIAGTKGKGTTCLILESLLSAGGKKVGTYLSPHVEYLRERIRVAQGSISEADLCASLNSILSPLKARHRLGDQHFPTFFELMTALAMVRFKEAKVDYAIYEVGLGGRLDATNILNPDWTVITGIGLEHTEKLGKTLARIAREKAGIIKPGVPIVTGNLPQEARTVVHSIANSRSAEVVEVPPSLVELQGRDKLRVAAFGGLFPCGAVRGPGLRSDLAVAVTLWRRILEAEGVKPSRDALQQALAQVCLPARVESFQIDPPVLLDGAHTVESIRSLRVALEEIAFPYPRCFVVSMASDKRIGAILTELGRVADDLVFTCGDSNRSEDPDRLARRFGDLCGGRRMRTVVDPIEALHEARRCGPVVVTGSIYLTGRIRRHLRQCGG